MADNGNLYVENDCVIGGNIVVSNTPNSDDVLTSTFQTNMINMVYPIGSIFTSVNNTNPGTFLPGTTWTAWGTGCVPVGVNTSDSNFNTVEKTGGAATHTLTEGRMPQHYHTSLHWTNPNTASFGVNYGSAQLAGYPTASWYFSYTGLGSGQTAQAGFVTGFAGSGQGHNNLQPYITCYMWKRTA